MPMTVTVRAIAKWRNKGWSTMEILEYFGLKDLRDAAVKRGDKDTEWRLNTVANVIGELAGEAKTDLRRYQRVVKSLRNVK